MRILLVEDSINLSNALVSVFKREKFQVIQAFDGEEGLDYALSDMFDIIILDIMMPKKDGYTVLKEIRMNKVQTPIIMLTARSEVSDRIQGLNLGADDYLPKPFSIPELIARIKALTRRKGEIIEDNYLCFHNIKLNLLSYLLENGSDNVKLSQKEFEIMKYFMLNPTIVVTKERLIDRVWGFDSDFESNTVEVFISFLRKKLVFLNADFTIVALRGVGYQLMEREPNENI